jgi:hypothetical protein
MSWSRLYCYKIKFHTAFFHVKCTLSRQMHFISFTEVPVSCDHKKRLQYSPHKHLYYRCMLYYNGFLFPKSDGSYSILFSYQPHITLAFHCSASLTFCSCSVGNYEVARDGGQEKCLADLCLSFFTFFPAIFLFYTFYFLRDKERELKMLKVPNVTQ